MSYENILVETSGKVGVIRLNRPKSLNALNEQLLRELSEAVVAFDNDQSIGCMVILGSDKAFAAGADITELTDRSFVDLYNGDPSGRYWAALSGARKVIIAGVAGFALGGGCELAMMCDFIIAADNAKFGQPELKLGIVPGAGGTQRLPRAISKAKAMDMCLTGRMMGADESERAGLVARIVPLEYLEREVMQAALLIASMSQPAVAMIKESVNRAYDTLLTEGLSAERRMFYSVFATEDQKEGMTAFLEKRAPVFKNR